MLYYRPCQRDDGAAIEAITAYVEKNPRHGFGLLHSTFQNQGQPWGKTVLWRVYRELKLNLPRRGQEAVARSHSRTYRSPAAAQRHLVSRLHGRQPVERKAL